VTRGELECDLDDLGIACPDPPTVKPKEELGGGIGGPLVPLDKGVVVAQRLPDAGSLVEQIRFAVMGRRDGSISPTSPLPQTLEFRKGLSVGELVTRIDK
jgi:hypothetical protein